MTEDEIKHGQAAISRAADGLYEHFETVLILTSVVSEGVTRWTCRTRGNEYANNELARRFLRGEFDEERTNQSSDEH